MVLFLQYHFFREQKGARKGCWRGKDQLLVQKIMLAEAKLIPATLSMCWIDHKKAYASVPHGGILKSLQCIDLSERLLVLRMPLLSCWSTQLQMYTQGKVDCGNHSSCARNISGWFVQTYVFFCLTWNPWVPYSIGRKDTILDLRSTDPQLPFTHLLYMGDIELQRESN